MLPWMSCLLKASLGVYVFKINIRLLCSPTEKVSVKCNQTGKLFNVKVISLSRSDDGNMSAEDLAEGSQLLMKMNKEEYPVTVLKGRSRLKEALKEVQVNG